jgi:cyanate permease
LWALVIAVGSPTYVASLGSIQNFGGYFGGSFAPIVAGLIAQHTHSFAGALVVGACIGATSAVIYLAAVRHPRRFVGAAPASIGLPACVAGCPG